MRERITAFLIGMLFTIGVIFLFGYSVWWVSALVGKVAAISGDWLFWVPMGILIAFGGFVGIKTKEALDEPLWEQPEKPEIH